MERKACNHPPHKNVYQVVHEVVLGFRHFEECDDPASQQQLLNFARVATTKLERAYEQDLGQKIERKAKGHNFI